jgi:hypothetical protein
LNQHFNENAKYHPVRGYIMHCESCGAPVFVGSIFCAMCGVKIEEADEANLSDASSLDSSSNESDVVSQMPDSPNASTVDAADSNAVTSEPNTPQDAPSADSQSPGSLGSPNPSSPPPAITSSLLVSPDHAHSTPPFAHVPSPYTGPTIAQMLQPPKCLKVLGVMSLILAPICILITVALTGVGIVEFAVRTGGKAIVVTMIVFMVATSIHSFTLFIGGIGLVSGKTWGRKWALFFSWSMLPLFILLVIAMGAGIGLAAANGLQANSGIERVVFGFAPGAPILMVVMLAMFQVDKVQQWVYLKRQEQQGVDLTTLDPATLKVPNLSLCALFGYLLLYFPLCFGPLPPFILSIVALNKISKAKGELKGKGLAIFTLLMSILAFLAIIGGIVAIAVVSAQRSQGAQAANIKDELRQMVNAQERFYEEDSDDNGVLDYWVADLYSLSEFLPGVIDSELLRADQSPDSQVSGRKPYKGYWLSVLLFDDDGEEYATDPDGDGKSTTNRYKWAVCAYPADREGAVFVIDEEGIIYEADFADVQTVEDHPNVNRDYWRVVE